MIYNEESFLLKNVKVRGRVGREGLAAHSHRKAGELQKTMFDDTGFDNGKDDFEI